MMLLATAVELSALLTTVCGTIIVYTQSVPHSLREEIRDMPAEFGADVPLEGLRGLVARADPRDACLNLTAPPPIDNFTGNWIVLIAKAGDACTFERQVRNAQAAGFACAVVHNVNSSDLEVMTAADPAGIDIPAVFVSDLAGLVLAEEYLYNKGFYIMVNGELPFNINTHLLLPFAVVVAACLLVILVFMVVKCVRERRRARRQRLPARALDKILTWKYSKGDPYDTCAICLDDYRCGERLRVLPCAHAYHAACVDPWLTQSRRVCPVCKRRVFVAGERARRDDSDSDSDSSARQPLLRAASYPQGGTGTFDEQSENPFARATRFVARLRARQRAAATPPPSSSSDEDRPPTDSHSVAAEDTAALLRHERGPRRPRRPRGPRRHSAGEHSINDNASGEIGVAALPASPRHVEL